MGHEFVGKVKQVGSKVEHLQTGDLFVGEAAAHCGKCSFCEHGDLNLCLYREFYGFPPLAGGYQQKLLLPERLCIKLPDKMDPSYAALTEPLAISLYSLSMTHLQYGMSVGVIGCGPIGLMIIKLLKKVGVGCIIASEPNAERRRMAKQVGADIVVDPYREDLVSITHRCIDQHGVDAVFEACGKSDGIAQTAQIANRGADILLIGIPMDDKISVSHAESRKKGLVLKMVRCYNHTMKKALEELIKDPSYSHLISHRVKPENFNELIRHYQQPDHTILKSVLVF
jgi:L-iditol 2-dehydrogenase